MRMANMNPFQMNSAPPPVSQGQAWLCWAASLASWLMGTPGRSIVPLTALDILRRAKAILGDFSIDDNDKAGALAAYDTSNLRRVINSPSIDGNMDFHEFADFSQLQDYLGEGTGL